MMLRFLKHLNQSEIRFLLLQVHLYEHHLTTHFWLHPNLKPLMVDDFILFKIQTQNYISSRENATLWLKNLILDFLNQDFRAPWTAREKHIHDQINSKILKPTL